MSLYSESSLTDDSDDFSSFLRSSPPPSLGNSLRPPPGLNIIKIPQWPLHRAVGVTPETHDTFKTWWAQTCWYAANINKRDLVWLKDKKSSIAWQLFDAVARAEDGKPYIQCQRCSSVLSHPYLSNSGTTLLKNHLKSKQCERRANRQGNKGGELLKEMFAKQKAQVN